MKETERQNLNRIIRLTPHIMQIKVTMRRSYEGMISYKMAFRIETTFEWVYVFISVSLLHSSFLSKEAASAKRR